MRRGTLPSARHTPRPVSGRRRHPCAPELKAGPGRLAPREHPWPGSLRRSTLAVANLVGACRTTIQRSAGLVAVG